MRELFRSVLEGDNDSIDTNGTQFVIMGGALIFFNLFLMLCLGIYWINPSVHEYISGRPL